MADKPTISPEQFKKGLRRALEAVGKWSTGNTWIGNEPPEYEADSQYSMWVDTSGEEDKLFYKVTPATETTPATWKEISGSGTGSGSGVGVAIDPISDDTQTVSPADDSYIRFNWSTLNSATAKGTVTLYVNSVQKYMKTWEQGDVEIPVKDYLTSGKTNELKVVVRDIYGSENTHTFYVSVIAITISSPFKQNTVLSNSDYPEFYSMPFVVKGGLDKTVHVILDGNEITESQVTVVAADAGTTQYIKVPSCSHGHHTLKLKATATLNGITITSNTIFYDMIWTEVGNYEPIVVSSFNRETANQYEILEIPYFVHNPEPEKAKVFFGINGVLESDTAKEVEEKEYIWDAMSEVEGDNVFTITAKNMSGESKRTFNMTLSKVEKVEILPVTTAMPLCLIAEKGKSNDDEVQREVWSSTGEVEGINCVFSNFNWKTNGWTTVNNKGALKLSDGASVTIPYNVFAGAIYNGTDTDIRSNGATIEIDLLFSEVTNVDTPFLSCMSEGRGIEITPTQAMIKSSGMSAKTLFTEGDNKGKSMRFSFVITPEDPGVVYIYINGIGACADIYSADDRFKHDSNPVGITINSDACSVVLHSVRVYRTNLTQQQIIRNWIYDMASVADQFNAHKRNDIYDLTSNTILYSKVVERIPCMIITSPEGMPSYKGDKKIVDIKFEGTKDGLYDFVLKEAQIDVQGTSSQYYPIKNWKFKSSYKIEDDMGNVISKPKKKFEMKDGEVDAFPLDDGQIPAKVFCLKADYMESSSTHNTVTANIANGIYSEKTPPQKEDKTGRTRTTIYGRPVIVFYRDSEGSELRFGGKYNFNYDKDAEEVFGFVEDDKYEVVECVEFCNNTSERCLLQKSEYTNKINAPAGYDGDDLDANGQIPEYLQDFEFRYQWRKDAKNNIKYDYLKAATDWIVSTDKSKATGEQLATPYTTNVGIAIYLYDLDMNIVTFTDSEGRTRRAIDIGLGNVEYAYESYEVDELDLEGNPVLDEDGEPIKITYYALPIDDDGTEVYSFTHDTPAYRLTKFKNELSEHFNVHYSLMYYQLMDLLGMIDSSTKNCFWATWGERHEKHSDPTKDKVVIWYPIFYDMDTMLGLSNMGKMDIPYNAEFDSLMPSGDSYVFNGHSNVFWNNIKDAFVTELNTLFRSKVSDGTFAQQTILNAYEEHSENFSESVYNEDGNLKVISPYVDGYFGYSEDSPTEMVVQHPKFVYIYQGDRFYHRRYWFPNRYNYVCSKNMAGSYVTDYITMRLNTPTEDLAVPSNPNFTVVTSADQYTRVKYGSKTVFSRCVHNEPTEIVSPPDTFNDTETIIYGASRIMDIGSLADKYARSIDLSKAKRLTVANIGSDVEGYNNDNLDDIDFGSNPMMQEVYLQNCPNLSGTLDLSGCPRIKIIKANGTAIQLLSVPTPGILETVILPSTMESLTLIQHPNLNNFELASVPVVDEEGNPVPILGKNDEPLLDEEGNPIYDYEYNLTTMRIEGTPVDVSDLIAHSPRLTRIRLTDIDWELEDESLLHHIMYNLKGFTNSNGDQDRAVLLGDCRVMNMKDYIAERIHKYFNNDFEYENISQGGFRMVVENEVKTFIVKFYDSVNEKPMYSGILDDRVIKDTTATYEGDIPVKSEDWMKTYEFQSWGVYVNGELTPVTLGEYPIIADTAFYAIYKETKKPFTLTFYKKNLTDSTYSLYETKTIYYDTTYSPAIFSDDDKVSDTHAYRFKGWSTDSNASTADIPYNKDSNACGIIAVTEGSPYEQSYYPVYTLDSKYYVTFLDYTQDESNPLKTTKVYYTGDIVNVPNTPTRESTQEYVYTFDSWVFNGIHYKSQDIPIIGGSIYNITYVAEYIYDWRPYNIEFRDWDDSTIFVNGESYQSVPYGTLPEIPTGLSRQGDQQYSYEFIGWSPEVIKVEGDAEYKAQYKQTVNVYTVKFVGVTDFEGTVSKEIPFTQEYGSTFIPPSEIAREGYEFIGWDKEEVNTTITDDEVYTAQYKILEYKITFVDWDGVVKQSGNLPYNSTPEYDTSLLSRGEYYEFDRWDPEIKNVTGAVTYVALYKPKVFDKDIRAKTYNNWGYIINGPNVCDSDINTYSSNYAGKEGYVTIRQFTHDIPSQADIEELKLVVKCSSSTANGYINVHFYNDVDIFETSTTIIPNTKIKENQIFNVEDVDVPIDIKIFENILKGKYTLPEWFLRYFDTPRPYFEIDIKGDVEDSVRVYDVKFNVKYSFTSNKYSITWRNPDELVKDSDQSIIQTDVVDYGTMAQYTGPTPTITPDKAYTYTFVRWDKEFSEVTKDVVYTAVYSKTPIDYTVKFIHEDGSVIEEQSPLHYDDVILAPSPIREGHTLRWEPSLVEGTKVSDILGDDDQIIITAKYDKIVCKIEWKVGPQVVSTGTCYWGDGPNELSPPSGYEAGEFDIDGIKYTVTGWDIPIVTEDDPNVVTVISASINASITAVPTINAYNNGISYVDEWLAGTRNYFYTSSAVYSGGTGDIVILKGFDFSKLKNITGLQINNVNLFLSTKNSASGRALKVQLASHDSGSTVSSIGMPVTSVSTAYNKTEEHNLSNLTSVANWINNNKDIVICDKTASNLAIYVEMGAMTVYEIEVTLEFTSD